MNKYAGYAQPVPTGYRAMLRFCRDAKPLPVMAAGECPKVFSTEGEAWKEIALHLLAFMNGHEIRGEMFNVGGSVKEAKRAKFEKLFSKGRVIEIERKAGAA